MQIIFPLAGRGQRFVEAGYTVPKLFLPLQGKRLIQWAVEPLASFASRLHYYVSLHVAQHPLRTGLLPPGCWHVVIPYTPGPLQTLLSQPDCLKTEEEVLIADGDSYMDPRDLEEILTRFRDSPAQAGTPIRSTKDASCAFVQLDEAGWIQQTREKDPFTPWSATGPYWFRSGALFLQAARQAAKKGEVSIAPVFNELQQVKGVLTGSFIHLGKPKDYEAYKESSWI